MLSAFIYPIIWLLIKSERILVKVSDTFINKTITVFEGKRHREQKADKLVAQHLMPYRLTDYLQKRIRTHNIDLQTSFASAIFLRSNYSSGLELPETKINSKTDGLKFAHALGIRTPEIYQENVSFREVQLIPDSVIKPDDEYSAKGVFMVKSEREILELSTGKIFNSREQLFAHMSRLVDKTYIRKDEWIVEQMITDINGNPAQDIKFNVFYGEIGWIAAIKRHPEEKVHMMDGEGNLIFSELYKKSQCFISEGVNKEELKLAEKISIEIPAPFIRIDFLRGSDGLYFGEFTPRPGVIGFFKRKRDHEYGQMFHDAEARLSADLIGGKSFKVFNDVTVNKFADKVNNE